MRIGSKEGLCFGAQEAMRTRTGVAFDPVVPEERMVIVFIIS
jgi:hypothetical protein